MEAELKQPPPKGRRRWVSWILLTLVLLLLAAVAVPNFVKASATECQNACINNLRQLDGAKEQWAIENQKIPGYVLTPPDELRVLEYIRNGRPICPAGGSYSLNPIGEAPSCNIVESGLAHALVTAPQ